MSILTQNTRFKFITPQQTFVFVNAPIGWDEVEQDIKRSKKSDGIVLNITQNLQFIKEEKAFLINEYYEQGAAGQVEIIREEKVFNDFEKTNSGYVDLSTLVWGKTKATADFTENLFDEVLRSSSKEKFELDRNTDINGNGITGLIRQQMLFKHREIFLRSELENTYADLFSANANTPYFSPPLTKTISSDERVVSTFPHLDQTYFIGFNLGDDTKTFPQAQQFFYFRNDRLKTIKLEFDIEMQYQWNHTANQTLDIRIQKSKYETGGAFTPINLTTIHQFIGSGSSSTQTLTFSNVGTPIEFELDVDECLSYVIAVSAVSSPNYNYTPVRNNFIITEDSFFEPDNPQDRFVDCVTLYTAFKRVIEILDPTVEFKSDFILNNWPDLPIFSGETARHVLYDGAKAVLGTVSFDSLFKFLFTIAGPVAFGIRKKGRKIILEVEELRYFFSDEVVIELSGLTQIERKVNNDKVYSRIEIGFNKSGENEDIFGLQATNTVNVYGLPKNKENTYDATCDFRTDPNELELCYRKQFSLFPDTDTRYDKDIFAVDCAFSNGIYIPNDWQTHFSAVSGIFSPNTAYNYRFTPMNCLLRHGKGFKQEFMKPAYNGKSIIYLSTKGNVSLSTQITGGILRAENDNVLLTDTDNPLFTAILINGTAPKSRALVKTINGGVDKQNYYKTITFINENGNKEFAFVSSFKIDNDIKAELYQKYGF